MNKFKFIFSIISLLFLSITLSNAQTGQISGVIINKSTKEKLFNINVTLIQIKDSTQTQYKGTSTNENGAFSLVEIANGHYVLKASAIGYKTFISPIIEVKPDSKINTGNIEIIEGTTELKGVEIAVKKPFIERQADKTILNVENDPAGTGDNAFELLKKIPGVIIENENTIKLNGKTGILILIDNRNTYLSGDALIMMLKNIPATSIEKIEAIANPSEKYDAAGASGIINLKMKKNNSAGLNGSVYASGGIYPKSFLHTEGLDISSRFKNITIYGGIANNSYPMKMGTRSEIIYPNGISFNTNTENGEDWLGENKNKGQNYKLGMDYQINSKNTIGFVWRMSNNNSEYNNNSYTRINRSSTVDSSYHVNNGTNNKYGYNMINLNYKHNFTKPGAELIFDFDISKNNTPFNSINSIKYYAGNFITLKRSELTENKYDFNTTIYSAKADFEQPLSPKLHFFAGTKVSFVKNDNDLTSMQNGTIDLDRTNHFLYDENIFALYSGLNINFNPKTSARLGLRGEYTNMKGDLKTTDSTFKRDYFDIFPSLSIRRQINKSNDLDFAYRYRIERPNYSSLNPFLYKSDQFSYHSGNPDLKPQYSHNFSLSHSFQYKIFTSISYSYSKDQYSQITTFTPNFISISKPENIGTNQLLWFSINGSTSITKWWYSSIYAGFGWGNSKFNYVDSLVSINTFNSTFWFGQYFTITKNITFELSGWGQPKSKTDNFGTNPARFSINAGIRHTFLDKKLNVRLSINDIFNTANTWDANHTYPNNIVSKSKTQWDSRSLWLTISYSFGKENIQIRQRQTASEEEQGRTGGSVTGGSEGSSPSTPKQGN